jgi:cyclopropane fatty-acyl-phospholipid synthase-like methyltransferase
MHVLLARHADLVVEHGPPAADDVVLDLGCGAGGPGRYVADRFGCTVVGVDLLPHRVEVARALTVLTGLRDRVEHAVADATDTGFRTGAFAQVWMLDVGIHVEDKADMFHEITRVLRPGGMLVMHDQVGPLPRSMDPVALRAPYYAPSFSRLVEHVEIAGLRVVAWHDTTPDVLAYFAGLRALVGGDLPPPETSDAAAGLELLQSYYDTFSDPAGRSGLLLARRPA